MIAVGTDGPGSAERSSSGSNERVDAVTGAVERSEDVARGARPHLDLLAVARHGDGPRVEVGAAHFEMTEGETARSDVVASDRERHGMVVGEHEGRAGTQHAVHLAQQPVDVFDLRQHAGGEREVDRVGA